MSVKRAEAINDNRVPKLSSGARGAVSELIACAALMNAGWLVYRNCSPHGAADLVAWDPDEDLYIAVDVKSARCIKYPDREIFAFQPSPHPNVRTLIVTQEGVVAWADDFARADYGGWILRGAPMAVPVDSFAL